MMIRQNGQSLQEQFAPSSICFGCGPANEKGLRIRSIVDGDHTSAVWQPHPHHEAFPNVLSGGIIGTLLDCHSNWTAAWAIMNNQQAKNPPCTVTAEYKVKLLRPCPTKLPIDMVAFIEESNQRKAVIRAELKADGKITATCEGVFIAVTEGHPAYNRW